MPQASASSRHIQTDQTDYTSEHPQEIYQPLQHAVDDRCPRQVTFRDSYNVLSPSKSRDNAPRGDTEHLIGYQKDLQLKERQRQKQRAEFRAAKAPADLRSEIKANKSKRARKQVDTNRPPNPSPTQQPENVRAKLT